MGIGHGKIMGARSASCGWIGKMIRRKFRLRPRNPQFLRNKAKYLCINCGNKVANLAFVDNSVVKNVGNCGKFGRVHFLFNIPCGLLTAINLPI